MRNPILTLLAGLAVLPISACGPSGESDELFVGIALLPSEQEPYARILAGYTERTGIRVRLVAQQYQQLREAVQAEAHAGTGQFDLVELDVYLLPQTRGLMFPLDTLATDALSRRETTMGPAWDAATFGPDSQGVFFVPHRLNWQALLYDTHAIPSPPDTWEELLAVAQAHPGAIGIKGARYEGMVCDLFPFLWQAGADPLTPSGPGVLQALRFLQKLSPFLNPAARSYRENTILQAQERSEIILHPNWPFAVPLLREKGLFGGRVRSAPLPRGPARRATVLGGGYLGIPLTAPHPREAARLLDYLTSPEVQRAFAAQLGWFPILEEAWDGFGAEDRLAYAGFFAMRADLHERPAVSDYDLVSRIWQEGFSRLLFHGESAESVVAFVSSALKDRETSSPQ